MNARTLLLTLLLTSCYSVHQTHCVPSKTINYRGQTIQLYECR